VSAWTFLYTFGTIEGCVCFISSEGGANPIPVFFSSDLGYKGPASTDILARQEVHDRAQYLRI
jgi:hypothetical protein